MKKNLYLIFIPLLLIVIGCSTTSNINKNMIDSNQFTWLPEKNELGLSNTANRYGLGIIDGDGKTLYYQSVSRNGDTIYSLFSYDLKNDLTEEVSLDCYGMINVTDDSVYYIGYETKGVYRFDRINKRSKLIYSGDIKNLLVQEKYIFIIDSNNELIRLNRNGNNKEIIMKEVLPQYLDYNDGCIYFFLNINNNEYKLFKSTITDKIQNTQKYDIIGYPIKYWNNNILYKDVNGIYLINIVTKEKFSLQIDVGSHISVNGNGIFFTQTDKDGYTELKVYDLNTSKIFNLTPTHFSSIYFINNEIYVVDIVNFKAEVIDLTNPSYIHTVKIDL